MDSKSNHTAEEKEPSIDGQFRLKISRDNMSVHMHHMTAPTGDGKAVDVKKVLEKLKQSKVVKGINKEAIETALSTTANGNPPAEPVLIVESLKPVKSENSQLNWVIDPESGIRARIVLPGQLLLTLKPSTSGEPGRDVYGKKIRVQPGIDRAIKAENGVSQKIVKGVMEYYAEMFGLVKCEGDKLSVSLPVVVSDDGLSASMDIILPEALHKGEITKEHVVSALKMQGVCFGINEEVINQAINNAGSANDGCMPNIIVANGKPAVNGKDGYLEWLIDISNEHLLDRTVIPGQPFAAVHSPTPGEPGVDIYNKPIPAVAGKVVTLNAGDGVAIRQAEGYCEHMANTLGVARQHDNIVEIVTPAIKISPDGLEARMDLYTRSAGMNSCNVEVGHITDFLKKHNVVFGVDEDAISKLLADARASDKKLIKHAIVASGTVKKDGISAHLELAHELSPAIKLSGGRLNLHELDYPWDVKKGMLLGKFIQSEMAKDGVTVTGKKDAAKKVKEVVPELTNIRLEETGDLISEMDGSFMVDGFKLEVTDLVVVKGNVNLHTGNIHTESAVLVKGHVTQGFIVEAKGEVVVEQNVEEAVVKSESRVTVRGGVRGHSKIYSGGDFSCGFIEFGEVVAEDNIEILKNAIDANLVAGNNITIGNGQGIIIASKCMAGNEIWVGMIGHPSSEVCEFWLGMPEGKIRRLHHLHSMKDLKPVEKKEYAQLKKMYRRSKLSALRVSGKIESDALIHIGRNVLSIQNTPCAHDYYVDPEKNEITYRLYDKKLPIPGRKKRQ